MKFRFTQVVVFSTLFSVFVNAETEASKSMMPKEALIEKMQKGGLVMYFRHASTEKDYADQVKADVNDGSTQRVLSEKGWHEAVHLGNAVRFHNIPIGKVISSDYFRAWQTAWLAFGEYEKNSDLNFLPFAEFSDEHMAKMKKRVLPFLSTKPEKGKNTVIVAHDDPFEAATGIYPDPQGICYVLEPKGKGSFKILGSLEPSEW